MDRTASPKLYQRVQRQLAAADVDAELAEVHGVLCGLLCAGRPEPLETWLAELFDNAEPGDLLVDECRDSLRKLYRDTLADMEEPGLGFSLLLPGEDRPVDERARALGEWCQGFLYGVGLSGVSPVGDLSQEAREALRDFAEISRVDEQGVSGGEEDEEALTEIYEFVWVAAMLIREELVHGREGRQ
ncbi:MAG: YecA family protein [Chromatiales bacterium]|jgi:hypothetical protein